MKNKYNKKIFITISSGLLLTLVTNQGIVYASESEGKGNIPNISVIENLTTKDDSDSNNINSIFSKENEVLIREIKLSITDEQIYKLSGVTFKNSLIEIIVDNNVTTNYIVQSDEEGLFELEVTDLLTDSVIQTVIKDSENTIQVRKIYSTVRKS